MRPLAPALPVALLLAAPPSSAQAVLWSRPVPPSGRAIEGAPGGAAFLGDLDGDQVPDLALLDASSGVVELCSGADGGVLGPLDPGVGFETRIHAVEDRTGDGVREIVASGRSQLALIDPVTGADLWRRAQPPGTDWLGEASLATISDLDGDGVDELVVGYPGEYFRYLGGVLRTYVSNTRGFVELVSGATGAQLLTIANPDSRFGFGGHVSALDDVDGDGLPDLLIASNNLLWSEWGGDPAPPSIWSTRTGTFLRNVQASAGFPFGANWTRSLSTGDIDGDGAGDVLISMEDYGLLAICSGATGAPILQRFDPTPADGPGSIAHLRSTRTGSTLSWAGDVDGDGAHDLWIGSPMVRALGGWFEPAVDRGPGRVDLISGRTLETLDTIVGDRLESHFGGGVLAAPDLNGDGDDDVLVWTTSSSTGGGWALEAFDTSDGSVTPRISCLPRGSSGGRISWSGSTSLTGSPPAVTLTSAPPASLTLLVSGTRPAFDAVSWGTTCVGGALERVAVSAVGASGSTTMAVSTVGLAPGDRRTYQWLWRDGAGGLASSDAVSATFLP